jgi:ATP-dependent Clp protease adaptor protein ClpS
MSTSTDIVIDDKVKTTLEPPNLYKVLFLNDDKTPMDFVIELLTGIFKHNEQSAKRITLEVHESGSGVAGVYSYEIAEHKAIEATNVSKENGFPLQIKIEEE